MKPSQNKLIIVLIASTLIVAIIVTAFMLTRVAPAANTNNTEITETETQDEEIKVVKWVTEAWPNFTQEDGVGVYHDLMRAIFASRDVELEVSYASWKRSLEDVKAGIKDMTGGLEPSDEFYQSKYPIWEKNDLIVFEKDSITWEGLESLVGKQGVWVRGYLSYDTETPVKEYAQGVEIETFENTIQFLLDQRADYLLTEAEALENHSKLVEGFNLDNYEIINIVSGQLYMSFPKTERGRKIRDIHDAGYEALTREEIKGIYSKWDLPAPLQ